MEIKEIHRHLDEISAVLVEKGIKTPTVAINIQSGANIVGYCHWWAKNAHGTEGMKAKNVHCETVGDALADLKLWANSLPDPKQRMKDEATAAIGRALEMARDADLEVEFINPLEAMMKKLSENAITDQSNDASE